MNKLIITPTILSLLTLTLVGCGGEDDGVYGSGNGSSGSNELIVSSFDKGIDSQTNKEAVVRIDSKYRTGDRDIKVTNIVGNYTNHNTNNLKTSVVLGNLFEGTLEDKDIEVNNRTVTRPIYEKNSNNRVNYKTTYKTLSLAGVDARNYIPSNNFGSSRGIFTDLNNYSKIPNNLMFPAGSVCYIPVTTSDRAFFVFNAKDKTGYKTLDSWTKVTEKRFNDNRPSSTTELYLGVSNKQKAVQAKFFATDNDPIYLYNAIDYDGSIYEANYIVNGQTQPNENSIRGVVDCTLVNDVAANFLEDQIKRYY
ncbi:hypothetical protein [Psychrobacter urativorans]|uniref:Lipoprotein n=1 Tax=Psychrobacter urativorans TaxID=45610 RepID=A0A0M4U7D5_9GAMM|nr:hypothetical protein [Psychrobacter urativorans]ALF60076.1 hypothetical protein AOC03_08530 [Psychrobacter urativorans]